MFSHLSEYANQVWIHEFARVVKAAGLVVVTTHSRSFIDFCASLRKKQTFESEWQSYLARCFIDPESAKRDYAEGRFLYAATGEGDREIVRSMGRPSFRPRTSRGRGRPYGWLLS